MIAKLFVLILAASLVGAAAPCLCEASVQAPASCGQCPEKSAPQPGPCPDSDCNCVHDAADRVSEDHVAAPPVFAVEVPTPGLAIAVARPFLVEVDRGILLSADPPLYLLFRHFLI